MNPIDVFIAYAKQDKVLMERLRKQLSAAERIGLVDAWHDGEIEVGTDREEASRKAMENAEIVVLLLSADFFASEYLYEKEMAQALKLSKSGKATVIPVLLKECTWQLTPLSKLQVLPKNQIPVSNEHWKHPDRAFKHVVDEIIRISNQIQNDGKVPDSNLKPIIETKTDEKQEGDKTPLWKLALIAIASLAAFALISFAINQFSKPAEKEKKARQETLPKDRTGNREESVDHQETTIAPPFQTLTINDLEWSASNIDLKVEDSWCYNDKAFNCKKNGRLYNYKAAQQICPAGWRLPDKTEWMALSNEEIIRLNLSKGGVYDRGGYRQAGKIGYYFTPERTGGDLAWVIEFRGNEKPLQTDRRYQHWGMSCRCVR